jgi:hypothetical protein
MPNLQRTITDADYAGAAWFLGCDVPAMQAVAAVEGGPWGAFYEGTDQPVVLFERHKFHQHTGGRFDAKRPDLSNPVLGGYGKASAQPGRLADAYALDPDAALRSASWGLFQVMGENHQQAGYQSVLTFVAAMRAGVDHHLRAFCSFIRWDAPLHRALVGHDWQTFAKRYNGPRALDNGYHLKIADAYRRLTAPKG